MLKMHPTTACPGENLVSKGGKKFHSPDMTVNRPARTMAMEITRLRTPCLISGTLPALA
jgi:hypothetical protein